MGAIERLTAAGFLVELLPPDLIGITPVERLTDEQIQWVKSHRDELLSELIQHSANDRRRLDRWHGFIELAVDHGAEPGEVRAMFNQQDIDNLFEEPDCKLPLHARTIADAVKRSRPIICPQAPATPTTKRCIDCKHFARTDHPHIGLCQAGEPMGSSGNWDTDARDYCRS